MTLTPFSPSPFGSSRRTVIARRSSFPSPNCELRSRFRANSSREWSRSFWVSSELRTVRHREIFNKIPLSTSQIRSLISFVGFGYLAYFFWYVLASSHISCELIILRILNFNCFQRSSASKVWQSTLAALFLRRSSDWMGYVAPECYRLFTFTAVSNVVNDFTIHVDVIVVNGTSPSPHIVARWFFIFSTINFLRCKLWTNWSFSGRKAIPMDVICCPKMWALIFLSLHLFSSSCSWIFI